MSVYMLYMRSEEAMMLEYFGDAHRRYRERVPMLLPFRRRRGRESAKAAVAAN